MIRNARPEDAGRLAEIAEAAWQPVWAEFRRQLGDGLFEQLYPDAVGAKREQVIDHATHHPDWFFVAESAGRVVGFVGVRLNMGPDRVTAEIGNNAVDPVVRGRGIGPGLYEHAMAYFREHGQTHVMVVTGLDDAHAPARRAYEKVGLKQACPMVSYIAEL